MTQAITQAAIEAAKVVIMAVRQAHNLVNNVAPMHTMPGLVGPVLRQPAYDWKLQTNIRNCAISKQMKEHFFLTTISIYKKERGSQ